MFFKVSYKRLKTDTLFLLLLLLSAEFWQLVKTLLEHKYSYQNLVPHLLSAVYGALLGRRGEMVSLGRRKLYHFFEKGRAFYLFYNTWLTDRQDSKGLVRVKARCWGCSVKMPCLTMCVGKPEITRIGKLIL